MTGMHLIRSKRGLAAKIARELNMSPGAIAMWQDVPAERVVVIEKITGISRALLRPDLYADMPAAAAPTSPNEAAA